MAVLHELKSVALMCKHNIIAIHSRLFVYTWLEQPCEASSYEKTIVIWLHHWCQNDEPLTKYVGYSWEHDIIGIRYEWPQLPTIV